MKHIYPPGNQLINYSALYWTRVVSLYTMQNLAKELRLFYIKNTFTNINVACFNCDKTIIKLC